MDAPDAGNGVSEIPVPKDLKALAEYVLRWKLFHIQKSICPPANLELALPLLGDRARGNAREMGH